MYILYVLYIYHAETHHASLQMLLYAQNVNTSMHNSVSVGTKAVMLCVVVFTSTSLLHE